MLLQEVNNISTDWKEIISNWINTNTEKWNDIENNYNKQCINFKNSLEVFPEIHDIFRCFKYFNSSDTRVVILGQDPYHGANQATGLCFGVSKVTKKPPSLKNIEKVLIKTKNVMLNDQTLESWAKQGILLLNASLTVLEKTPGAHLKYWKNFTQFVIDYINKNCENIVFVAWGAFAYNKMKNIDLSKNHLLVSSHPSPFSYYRNYQTFPSFENSDVFNKIDNLLKEKIVWGTS